MSIPASTKAVRVIGPATWAGQRWQFKAESVARVTEGSVKEEIPKDYAAGLVRRGYGYPICVCDEITAEKRSS